MPKEILRHWMHGRSAGKLNYFFNKILPILPAYEKYNFYKQIRIAARSITANIAEGYGRFHYQESIQFTL